MRLFVERARAANPKFALTGAAHAATEQICTRLDGIPLAIELAAARTKLLSAEQIAERLDDAFRLLVGGSRTALPRQQTLRALIDWSYDLLAEEEQQLLRSASVFMGGWKLEALEAVTADPQALEHLEDSSKITGCGRRTQRRDALFHARDDQAIRQGKAVRSQANLGGA